MLELRQVRVHRPVAVQPDEVQRVQPRHAAAADIVEKRISIEGDRDLALVDAADPLDQAAPLLFIVRVRQQRVQLVACQHGQHTHPSSVVVATFKRLIQPVPRRSKTQVGTGRWLTNVESIDVLLLRQLGVAHNHGPVLLEPAPDLRRAPARPPLPTAHAAAREGALFRWAAATRIPPRQLRVVRVAEMNTRSRLLYRYARTQPERAYVYLTT